MCYRDSLMYTVLVQIIDSIYTMNVRKSVFEMVIRNNLLLKSSYNIYNIMTRHFSQELTMKD